MKKGLLPIVLAMSSITASTYYITIDKKFKPYYNTEFKWEESTSLFTEWLDVNTPFDYTQFLPEISNQDTDFQQSRTFKQEQERYEQKREYDQGKDIYKDVGEPIHRTQTITKSETRTVNVLPLVDWTDIGSTQNCTEWNPATDTVLYGDEFTQSRQCDQERTRTLEYYIDSNLEHTNTESLFFPIIETQQNFGTNSSSGWVLADPNFTEWVNLGESYDYLGWTPDFNNQTENFQQYQNYSQDQQQFEQAREQNTFTSEYRDIGEPIEHNQTITETETRDIITEVDVWINNGSVYDCSEWSPAVDTIVYGEEFTQSRDCSQDQDANISYKFESVEIATGLTSQTIIETENQQATGTNASSGWVTTTSTFTEWSDINSPYAHQAWNPAFNNQTIDFAQNRDYSQDQQQFEQQREQNTFTNEYRNVGSPIEHNQTITENEVRNITTVVAAWQNDGGHYNCGTFSPDPSTVVYGQPFTQERDCSQNQIANISYKVSGSEVSTGLLSQTITEKETQPNTGTNIDSGWSSIASTFTDWENVGSPYNEGNWTPEPLAQTVDFQQSRDYDQDQQRFEQQREQNSFTNAIRNVGEPIEHNQTLVESENRNVTVIWSDWENTPDPIFDCGAWSPSPSTIDYGVQFTQTQDCSRYQHRTRFYQIPSVNIYSERELKTITVQQTQQNTGTNTDGGWVSIASTFTDWTNTGAGFDHGTYAPAISNQTANFFQSRSYKQKQERYEQKREQNTYTNAIRNTGSPIKHEQNVNKTQSRTITVNLGGWSAGSDYGCGSWSPSEANYYTYETVNQSRSCKYDNTRTINYYQNTTYLQNYVETNTQNVTRNRTVSGTKTVTINKTFNFNSSTEGWIASRFTGNVSGGVWYGQSTIIDPQIYHNFTYESSSFNKVIVRARFRNISGSTMQLFWRNNYNGYLNETDSVRVSLGVPNGNGNWSRWKTYTIDMSSHSGWKGTVNQLRLDPFASGVSSGSNVEIDYIQLVK